MNPAEAPSQPVPSTPVASVPDLDPQISAFIAQQSALLHSRESWARQQVLDHLTDLFKDAMHPLQEMEQRSYLSLFRALVAAKGALDAESKGFVEAFEQAGLLALRTRIKQDCGRDLDPRTTYLHTAYAVESGKKRRAAPHKRSLDAGAGIAVDVATLSLWQAACLNFAFFDLPEMKRRWISHGTGEEDINQGSLIDVDNFIQIVRDLNLGADLRQRVEIALRPTALLPRLIAAYVREMFRFNLYDAARTAANTRLSRSLFDSLRDALERGPSLLKVEQVAIKLPQSLGRLMARVEFTLEEAVLRLFSLKSFDLSGIYLPALILRVSGESGLYSYCAERPGGVLRHHPSLAAFEQELKAQLKTDNAREALGWLISSLAFEQQSRLWQLIEPEHKPTDLNGLADKLYEVFHWVFPNQTLDDLSFAYHPAGGRPEDVLSRFYTWRFRLNTEAIAVPKSQQDLRAVKEGIVSLMHQLLDLLLTPVPGGLGSIGRMVMAAMAGHLALELVEGAEGAGEGRPEPLLQAGLEIANMLLLAGLHGYAGRLAYRRIGSEFKRLDKYRRVQLADGASKLWQPTLLPYARKSVELGSVFDEKGLSPLGAKLYGQVKERGQDLTVELEYDKDLKGYRATHPDTGQFHPPMTYDRSSRRWSVALDDSRQLSDARLLARMIALKGASAEQAQRILDISGVSREHLEQVWSGGTAHASLVEALERFEVDQGIAELRATDQEQALLSPCAQRALFALLPELHDWPADLCLKVHGADGELQEAYGRRQRLGLYARSVSIRRLADGGFVEQSPATDEPSTALASGYDPGVLALILGLLPSDSVLCSGTDPQVRRVRGKTLRHLLNALARERSGPLFEALGTHAGRIKIDVSNNAFGPEVGAYLPVFRSGVPAVLVRIRLLYPQLSLTRLAQFLRDNPLPSSQCQALLDTHRLPQRLRYALGRTQQLSSLGRALDGIYQSRWFQEDTDVWLQAIAVGFVRERLGRALKWIEGDQTFLADPRDLPLRRYGKGIYTALDSRRQPSLDLSSTESFYQAFAASLSTQEQGLLGMASVSDGQALRNAIGAYMGAQRRSDGSVGLALELYRCPPVSEGYRELDPPGLYVQDRRIFVQLDQRFYQVEQDLRFAEWRICHPTLKGAYAPLLEHNGQGGWWHEFEEPLAWDGLRAFRRLEPGANALSDTVARQVLAISGLDDTLPGRLLFENRRCAPLLSEVTRRFRQAQMDSPWSEVGDCDPGTDLQATFIRQQFPLLSVDMAQDLIEQADSSQRQLMRDYKRVPLALAQEARYLSAEVEVCRVYESLFLSTLRSDASDILLLQLLERLPGWSKGLWIELRRETAGGPLIASVGDFSAGVRRVLVKTDRGYEPFEADSAGLRSLAAADEDPFSTVLKALPQLKRTTLNLLHSSNDVEMDLKRAMFQSVSGDRNRIRQLLGQPPVLPWSRQPQRLMRLQSGALGYPMSGRARPGLYPPGQFRQLKKLYRGCSDAQVAEILASLGGTSAARARAVERLHGEYRQLKDDLARWQLAPQLEDVEDLPFGDTRVERRRKVARRLRRCWRRQSIAQELGPLRYVLVLDGLEVEDLPDLSADFSHVTLLSMNDMGLGNARYLSSFLRNFTGLSTLRMDGNGLGSLPNAVGALQALEELSLENNRLKLIEGTARELAGLTRLQRLNLNGNPLGVLPDFGAMLSLQVLRLCRTGIDHWPPGLLALRDLVRVELRENAIRGLPAELFAGHDQLCRGMDLSGNPLSPQALTAVLHYRQSAEHHDVVFGLGNLRLSSLFGIDRWAGGAEKTAERSAQWQRVRDRPNADVFFLLLDRMSAPPTFFDAEYQGVRSDLSARVWRLLKAASEDLLLCEELFRLEGRGRAVGLSSYQIFNRLELSVDCQEALRLTDQEAVQYRLLKLLRGQFRLSALTVAVGAKHPVRSLFWYRGYYDALAEELALPDQFNGLFTASPVHVSKQQAANIKAQVLREELPQALPDGSPGQSPENLLEVLLEGMIEELPEEIPQEPPEVLPDELPPEPAEERANAATPPLIGYLVANDSWSDFLIRAHEGDFQRVFGHLWAFDKRPEDSEYRHLWRTRLNQFQYNRRRSVWLTHWTVKALGKEGVSALGSA